ncbi:MAG TPA: T9SS type A sorting domain-containing protein [Bacteroidia bacterium]|nr:T9SS type A sorting domain-containing protein [Bacteroidia bacterium]
MKHLVLYLSLIFSLVSFTVFSQNWAAVTTGLPTSDGVNGGTIYAEVVFNGTLIAAGNFTSCNGTLLLTKTACNCIAQWNGTTWSVCGAAGGKDGVTGGTIYALAVLNGKLIAAGTFTKCNGSVGTACNYIAQWDGTNGAASWSVCGAAAGKDGVTGGGPTINALTIYSAHLVAGGYFTKCNGNTTACNNIAQWDGTNGAASWSICGAAGGKDGTESGNFPIAGLTVVGAKLVAGGAFNDCNGNTTACNNIAQWDGTNGATSWSVCGAAGGKDGINYAGTTIIAFTTYAGHLIVGGTFNGAVCNGGTTTCNYVAQWDGTNTITSWSALTVGAAEGVGPVAAATAVYSLNVSNGCLFIGGKFTTAAGAGNVNNVVYWNGSAFSGMGPTALKYGTSSIVYASTIYNSLLYAGGTITTCNNATTTCNDIASFTGGVLPIKLGYFDAIYSTQTKVVNLSWSTYTETNNSYFTVQRTADGENYEDVSTVPGAGNSDGTLDYTSVDEQPLLGTSYYRLKQTDLDGNYTYSNLQPVNIATEYTVNIFPNPVSETLTLSVYSQASSNVEVKIYNMIGELVSSYNLAAPMGNNTYPINVLNLPKGVYFIQCNTADKSFTNKFVKQ